MSHKKLKVTIRLEELEEFIESLGPGPKAARRKYLADHAVLSEREIGTLSGDGTQVSVPDRFGLKRWVPVKPFTPEAEQAKAERKHDPVAPDAETFAKRDREYFNLLGKAVDYNGERWEVREYYVGRGNRQWFRLSRPGGIDQAGVARTEFEVVQDV